MGAGAAMSPGSQMRALTANRARENTNKMAAGNTLERKKDTTKSSVQPFWGPTAAADCRQSRRKGCKQSAAIAKQIQPARC